MVKNIYPDILRNLTSYFNSMLEGLYAVNDRLLNSVNTFADKSSGILKKCEEINKELDKKL